MKFDGSVVINAPRDKVWSSLTDPNLVSQCAPGLQSLKIIEPDKQFKVVASVGLGAVKVTFDTDVEWVELKPPETARVKAHGKAPGSGVEVSSEMHLTENGSQSTVMQWTADVVIMGAIAGMASRLMGGITKKLSDSFFACIKSKIET
jgi:carbon monoxide dehydrogenase subunit G